MKIKLTLVLSLFTIMSLTSCEDEIETPAEATGVTLDKKGAVDIKVAESFITDGSHVLTTYKTVYNNTGAIVKVLTTTDTLPDLGTSKDTLDTGRKYTDDDDDEQEIDTVITHPKNYNFYFSVKTSK